MTSITRLPPDFLATTFKPRAQAIILSQVVHDAWVDKNSELEALRDQLNVVDEIVALFRRLYPADDMIVLQRYGKAMLCKSVSVRLFNPESTGIGAYNLSTMIDIPEEKQMLIPDGCNHLYAGGPRYSEDPNFGVKPEAREKMSDQDWFKIVEYHTGADARRLPKATEVFFERVAEGQNAYRREYKLAVNWPAEYKAQNGTYPTWGEIADQFPVLGNHLRKIVESTVDKLTGIW